MSQYRDDLEAARRRVETLEAKLHERDATIAVKDAEVAERDAELERLRRGPGAPPRGEDAHLMAMRQRSLLGVVLAGSTFAMAAGYVSVMNHAEVHQRYLGEPSLIAAQLQERAWAQAPAPEADEPASPLAAEPLTVRAPPASLDQLRDPFATPDEETLRGKLAPKVWSGRASLEEMRMLKAICSHLGDRSCRDRVSGMLGHSGGATPQIRRE